MLTRCFTWPARPLPPGALPALLLLLNHLFLFAPASSSGPPSSKVGKTLPPPQTWDGEPTVRLPGPNTDPLPTGAPGLELLVLTQGGPARQLLPHLACQHAGQTLGQGSDTAYTQPAPAWPPGSGCVPVKAAELPPFPKHWNETSGPRYQEPKSLLCLHHWGTRDEPQLFSEPQSSHL